MIAVDHFLIVFLPLEKFSLPGHAAWAGYGFKAIGVPMLWVIPGIPERTLTTIDSQTPSVLESAAGFSMERCCPGANPDSQIALQYAERSDNSNCLEKGIEKRLPGKKSEENAQTSIKAAPSILIGKKCTVLSTTKFIFVYMSRKIFYNILHGYTPAMGVYTGVRDKRRSRKSRNRRP
jgi:hypothetical protein